MESKLGRQNGKVKIELKGGLQLRSLGRLFRLESMTTHNSFRHAHSHHGHTGRGALLRVQVRL
jgi:hypothetical protein